MHLTNNTVAAHSHMADLMNNLTALQVKMQKVKGMFPNYHQHLLYTYNQLLLKARTNNMMPPWLG
ncbi:MAG: hypothetical protein ACKVOR_00540 [Flavobacteriales bacterium]